MTHLLDTSAVLAHHLGETGAERVQDLFDNPTNIVGICVLTLLELESRFHAMGLPEAVSREEITKYRLLFDEIIIVDEAVCSKAAELKFAASERVPNIDALIAAVASLQNSVLIHRDPHFQSIPLLSLKQEMLPKKTG